MNNFNQSKLRERMKRSCAVLFFILLPLSVFLPNLVFSAEIRKPSVAVLWFENRTPDRKLDYLDQLIPDLITTESSKLHFCNLLEREEIEKALDEVVLSRQGFTSPKEKVRGGIAETTDFILSGYFEKKEEGLVVSVRLYNWKKGISQTMDFTYALSEIKGRVGKEITEYLQKSINLKDDREKRAATIPKNARGCIIFLDVKDTLFPYYITATRKKIYDYPYGIIFLEELKDDLQSKGVSCEIITSKEDWDRRILQKNSVPAQSTRLYQVFVLSSCIGLFNLGTTDNSINPVNSQTEYWKIPKKEFFAPFSSFASLKNDISQYILGSTTGIETYGSEISSPKAESLIYYANYLRQKGYGDYIAAYQEILKALYLYPDFSFYWFILQESCYSLAKYEKEIQATKIYLGLSSWNEHSDLYSGTLKSFIMNFALNHMLSSEIVAWAIPLMEKIVYEGYENNDSKWIKTNSAVLLSRLYLLGEVKEAKIRNLKEKGLISEAEYQNDLCWALLMSKLSFTKEESFENTNLFLFQPIDWEIYSTWYAHEGDIPFRLPGSVLGRFQKSIVAQRDFLATVQETVRNYPDAAINFYIIRILSESLDHNFVEKELAKIAEEVPGSSVSHYIKFLRLKEEFFLTKGDKKSLIKAIAETSSTLGGENFIRSFLKESVKKKLDEETFLLLFSGLLKNVTIDRRGDLISNVAPESIRSRLESEFGLKREEPGEEGMKNNLFPQKTKETRVLLDAGLENLKEVLESIGWGTEIFSKETDLSNLSKYKLIILYLSSFGFHGKTGLYTFQPSFLSRIIAGLDNGVFILIITEGWGAISEINPLLSQFNCYVDGKKDIGSGAVFLPGIFKDVMDAHLDYHSSIGASPDGRRRWEGFFIKGPPIYTEKGKVIIQSGDGYPLAVSIPLSNGTLIISGDIYELFNLHRSWPDGELYDGLIFRNIWQILLKKMLGYESVLTPVSTIKELGDFYGDFRWGGEEILATQEFADPLSGWIKRKERSFPEEARVLVSAEILKEVLKENPDPMIRNYCFFYLGLIRRFQKQDEEAIAYFKKARENAINNKDSLTADFFLVDTLLRKENFSKDDYELCRKCCKEGTGIKIKDSYSFMRGMRFYDLQGRLEEKMKNYPRAVVSYEEMATVPGQRVYGPGSQYVAYALYRRACLIYKSGNLKEAEKAFLELIEIISKDYNLKPDSWTESDFYAQGKNDYGLIPLPFEIKVASYLYLRELAEKENRKFLYQTELEEVIQAAEKRNITDKDLLVQLRNVILREH